MNRSSLRRLVRGITMNAPSRLAWTATWLSSWQDHNRPSELEVSCLDRLWDVGVAIVSADDLIGSAVVDELDRRVHALYERSRPQGGWRHRESPASEDDPLYRLGAQGPLKRIVDARFTLHAKLLYADLWCILPTPTADRVASQRWHRDPEDVPTVKAFLYLSDVTEASGPLEFVSTSRAGCRNAHLGMRPTEVPSQAVDRVICKARSLVFFDASAVHRGGYAESEPRLSATWAWASPASAARPRFAWTPNPGRAGAPAGKDDT